MASPHPYSRVVFRQRLRAWLGRNRLIVAGASGVTVLILLGLWLLWSFTMPESWAAGWTLGMLQTAVVAALIHMLYALFLAHDPQAVWHVRGAWGEDNTRSELERAKRKGLIWGWVDSVPLQHGDIDHLVVPRRGNLIAIDSKWRSNSTDVAAMTQGAQRMRVRAEALTRDLLKADVRGARRARENPMTTLPVVVLWGPIQHEVPDGAVRDGIPFVGGRKLLPWLAALDGPEVSRDAATSLIAAIEERRDQFSATHQSKLASRQPSRGSFD